MTTSDRTLRNELEKAQAEARAAINLQEQLIRENRRLQESLRLALGESESDDLLQKVEPDSHDDSDATENLGTTELIVLFVVLVLFLTWLTSGVGHLGN